MRIYTTRPPRAHHAFPDADDHLAEQEATLIALYGGEKPLSRVGRIPRALAREIGSLTTIVWATRSTIQKIKGKHGEVELADLLRLQNGFDAGRVQKEGPRHLVFYYPDPAQRRTLKAVVKATRDGNSLFLESMHQVERRRLRLNRGERLRDW